MTHQTSKDSVSSLLIEITNLPQASDLTVTLV
jgi:hypothetical protein